MTAVEPTRRGRGRSGPDVVVVGSLNLDLVVRAHRLPGPGETVDGRDFAEFAGGKGLNQAVAAARAGASVALVGAVGDDEAGERLRAIVRDEGIDDAHLTTVAGTPSGRALISVDDAGENSIVVVPGANASASWPDDGPIGAVVLAQLEIPVGVVEAALAAASSAGATTVLNPAPALDVAPSLLASCSLVVPNEHEVELLGGAPALAASGVDGVIVTRGAAGVTIRVDDDVRDLPAPSVTPIDTTGAGDAFCGNLAARLAAGDELDAAVRWAIIAGALATTTAGAVPSLPHAEAVSAALADRAIPPPSHPSE